LDKPLHVIYKASKLAYRILVILIANERVKKKKSLRPIQAGVRQGSLLGSTLLIFILMPFNRLKMTLMLPSRSMLMTQILVFSGSIDIAVGKLSYAIALLEPWFQK
jgi:hypothetical protein